MQYTNTVKSSKKKIQKITERNALEISRKEKTV